jgi:hypothetical protein
MFFARRPVPRLAVSSWLIAVAVASVGVLIQRQPAHLTDPATCPGLLEGLIIAATQSGSRVPVAIFLAWLNGVGVFLAVLALTRWIQRAADSAIATAAVGLAAAATIVTTPALAPAGALAIGAATAALCAAEDAVSTGGRSRLVAAWIGLAITAAISPLLMLPLGIAAVWLTVQTSDSARSMPRLAGAALALIVVCGLPAAVTMMIPALPGHENASPATGCLLLGGAAPQKIGIALTRAFEGTGPVPIALAALGAFSLRHQIIRTDGWVLPAMAGLPLLAAAAPDADPMRTFAPTIAAFWRIVAIGAREVIAALAARPAWRFSGAVLVLLLPLLQWSHRSARPVAAADEPRGHERLARRDASQIFDALPSGSTIVIDDTITALLLRGSAQTALIRGKAVTAIARDGAASRAASDGRVFAMPRAQFDLQHQGLSRVETSEPRVPGIVGFERAGNCPAVAGEWRHVPDLAQSSSLALVATRSNVPGPVVIYLGSSGSMSPTPLDWSRGSLRGYLAGSYDLRLEADRQRLDLDGVEDQAPRDDRVFGFTHLARLEIWRVPGGPMILPIGLGRAPEAVLARGVIPAGGNDLRLCPSFPGEIERLELRR